MNLQREYEKKILFYHNIKALKKIKRPLIIIKLNKKNNK